MSLKIDLENYMHEAMRQKNDITRDTIRIALSAIKLAEIDSGKLLDDKEILTILQKEVKIRKETISELAGTERIDLVKKAQIELEILNRFLPEQITDEELTRRVTEAIANASAKSISDMGKVMGILVPQLTGQATPDRISQIVRKNLSQS